MSIKAEDLLDLPPNELYATLGRELEGESLSAFPLPAGEFIRRGKEWYSQRRNQFVRAVCSSAHIRRLLQDKRSVDRVMLTSAIADLISSVCFGVSPVVVAVLLIREGVESLCDEEPSP